MIDETIRNVGKGLLRGIAIGVILQPVFLLTALFLHW